MCQQSDIAPSFSRLRRISSRATVRRNAGEPFLLVRFRPRAATPAKNSYRPFEGVPRYRVSGDECPVYQRKQTRGGRIILSDEAKGVSL